MDTKVRADLIEFITTNYLFGDAERVPADDGSLMGEGVVDSTGILELIEYLESHFGIEVSEAETVPQNLDTIANLIRFVSSKKVTEELSA